MRQSSFKLTTAGLLTVATVLGSLSGCAKKGVSGEFTGKATGRNGGDIVVTMKLENSIIKDVKAKGDTETPGIGDKPLQQLPLDMVKKNSVNVDVISGSTVTSKAVIEAAIAALKSAGLKPEDLKATSAGDKVADVNEEADIVVIGAGGAGMSAAVVATDAGKKVIIIESQGAAGGNSVRSTGGMNATKTGYEDANKFNEASGVEATLKAAAGEKYKSHAVIQTLAKTVQEQWAAFQANPTGYFDSVELMELDTMLGGQGTNDFELVKTLAENSAKGIDWLKSIGAELKSVGQFGGASVKRIHRPVNAEGKTIAVGGFVVKALEKAVTDKKITVHYDTTAEKILINDGKVSGIEAKGKAGNKVTVKAKAVLLATGGFGANNEMVVAQNHPELKGYITTNAKGAQGQGITMATASDVKAATVDMDQIQLHPTVHVSESGDASLITEGLRGDGAILLNQEGKRFTNEVGTRDKVSAAENEQTGGKVWLVVDQAMVDKSAVIQGYIKNGFTVKGENAEALAKEMKSDAATVKASIEKWNACVEAGKDEEFNRVAFDHKLEGTLYALTVQPGIHHTMGGLKINTKTEVLNTDGKVIAGLFAAGEVTGGVHGKNRLGGNAVADFTVFGMIAGTSAANYVK